MPTAVALFVEDGPNRCNNGTPSFDMFRLSSSSLSTIWQPVEFAEEQPMLCPKCQCRAVHTRATQTTALHLLRPKTGFGRRFYTGCWGQKDQRLMRWVTWRHYFRICATVFARYRRRLLAQYDAMTCLIQASDGSMDIPVTYAI
jgi:hypothetical protein